MKVKLNKSEWYVDTIPLSQAREFVEKLHYAKGGSNTRVYTHGLFSKETKICHGITWWLPPTKSAALATYSDWQKVLSLSRLVVVPEAPYNSCSFLLSKSMKLIDRVRWPCLVTYADEWQGHKGTIYYATNWEYKGLTKPQRIYVKDKRMIARKAGPKTRTHSQMLELGAICLGSFSKHKFVHVMEK